MTQALLPCKPLNEDMDAQRWAREFIEHFSGYTVGNATVDEGLMIGWFANAIMCGFDEANRRNATVNAGQASEQNEQSAAAPASVSPQAPTGERERRITFKFDESNLEPLRGETAAGADPGKLIEHCTEAMNDTSAYAGADWVTVPITDEEQAAIDDLRGIVDFVKDQPSFDPAQVISFQPQHPPILLKLIERLLSAAPRPDAGEGLVEQSELKAFGCAIQTDVSKGTYRCARWCGQDTCPTSHPMPREKALAEAWATYSRGVSDYSGNWTITNSSPFESGFLDGWDKAAALEAARALGRGKGKS